MTSRERVLSALCQETLDHVPQDFWAEPPTWNRLLVHTGFRHPFVAPYLNEMIERIHDFGAEVLFHSCGSIASLIPELIGLGVDVLDPIQPSGPAMQPETLKKAFSERLCFHVGIDMQNLLPHGTTAQVRTEVRRYCDELGPGAARSLDLHTFSNRTCRRKISWPCIRNSQTSYTKTKQQHSGGHF